MNSLQYPMKSPIGTLFLVASETALTGVYWKKQDAPIAESLEGKEKPARILAETVKQLTEYFAGSRTEFTLPLDFKGTDFQRAVWKSLQKIPYGKTCSYRDLAKRIKNDRAIRAVGTANGRNPISIIIPCHRVIASDGSLGGYAGGLEIKKILLDLERKR